MAIHFISGKPGHGKTLYAVGKIVRELIRTERKVVTNVALDLPRLNEYIQEKYPQAGVDLHSRLQILDEEQAKTFWKFRYEEGQKDIGVLYVLDEIHLYFNAREWMNTGKDCLHYISQHRKLCDDILAITQSIGNVDKQFRSVAEDFSVMRNEYTAKFGPFRGRGRFTRKTYDTYTGDTTRQVPFEVSHFKLDASGIASCYNTSAGVGVLNDTNPHKLKPAKGIPIMWIWPALALVVVAVTMIPRLLSNAFAADISEEFVDRQHDADHVKLPEPVYLEDDKNEVEISNVKIAGYYQIGGKHHVILSDGSSYDTTDRELEKITKDYVQIDGRVHRWNDI